MISLQKEHELESYETAGVSFGLFLNFTFVTMRGPNKTIETENWIQIEKKLKWWTQTKKAKIYLL